MRVTVCGQCVPRREMRLDMQRLEAARSTRAGGGWWLEHSRIQRYDGEFVDGAVGGEQGDDRRPCARDFSFSKYNEQTDR